MARPLAAGDRVQTALGKGTVRELRNAGRVLVEIQGRSLVLDGRRVKRLDDDVPSGGRRPAPAGTARAPGTDAAPAHPREVDLHGLRVEEALARIEVVLDACMRDNVAQLRVIHGRSGGKLRAALHRRLSGVNSVRAFQIDTRNPGVTVVWL